jgi:hypothetical protein
MALHRPLESLSDDQLLSGLAGVAGQAQRIEVDLVSHIAEVDIRRLYLREACPSMFVYCTRVLHLAEGEAFRRIRVARASRRHPVLLEMLGDGRLHVSGIAVLAPILTTQNRDWLLSRAVHKSKREIERLVAEVCPRPDVPSTIRKLPETPAAAKPVLELIPGTAPDSPPGLASHAAPRPAPTAAPVVEPLSPNRYKIQFTAGEELHGDLERLRALLRHEFPDGDLGAIVGKAVRELRKRLEARRFAQASAPRKSLAETNTEPSSRDVPAAVRRAVYLRDASQCRFLDGQGRRCPERHELEYHHRDPFGRGGDHDVANVCLMCGPHNRYLAELDYGKQVMSRYRELEPALPGTSSADG